MVNSLAGSAGPLISIVIPFYNAEQTVLQAVRSVFAQTYANWELILLNDGSTDQSLTLVSQVQDERVRVVSDGVNRGLIFRLNQMADLCLGDYIARMDADDLMAPHRLERQLAVFEKYPETDVVASGIASLSGNFQVIGVREMQAIDMSPQCVLRHGGIVHPSIMARRSWFQSHPYREGYERAEDRELFLRALLDTRFYKICEPLYFYMESGVQSRNKILRSYQTERKVILEYGPRYMGGIATLRLWLRSVLKSVVVTVLSVAGQLDWLANRRIPSCDIGLRRELQVEVDGILALSLPTSSVAG